jgi:prepilin peptidase CpaA
MPVMATLDIALLLLVTVAGVHDLINRRIPNRVLMVALAVALPLQASTGGAGLLDGIGGLACGMVLFMPLYLLRGMAAGDVKLLATVGAFAGPAAVLQIGILAWCLGGVMALVMIICRGQLRAVLANLRELLRPLLMRVAGMPAAQVSPRRPSVGNMPYGLAIALATIAFVWGRHT